MASLPKQLKIGHDQFTLSVRPPVSERPKPRLFLPIQIRDLVQKLQDIENVEEVRYISQIPGDIHSLIFQVKVITTSEDEELEDEEFDYESNSNSIDNENIYKTAQTLVLKTCKHLRDTTGEKWYLRTQLVTEFDEQSGNF